MTAVALHPDRAADTARLREAGDVLAANGYGHSDCTFEWDAAPSGNGGDVIVRSAGGRKLYVVAFSMFGATGDVFDVRDNNNA